MTRRLAVLFLGLPLLAGCTSTDEGDGQQVELTLPTQDESDAAAARRINRQNADAEFEKLVQEIEGAGQP